MSHTWKVTRDSDGWWVDGPEFIYPTSEITVLGNEADARLIAAAPELLEALIVAEARLRELYHEVYPQGAPYYEPASVQARAAIAKATTSTKSK